MATKLQNAFPVAYLHGFAGSSKSLKAVALEAAFARRNVKVHLPDLNRPSFEKLTYTDALAAITEMHTANGKPRWNIVGSSFGGYLAARWAMLNPDAVNKMVLLCPAFDFVGRLPHLFGKEGMSSWERNGSMPVPDASGVIQNMRWKFVEDARTHPQIPSMREEIPTLIYHGKHDRVIPLETSENIVGANPFVQLRVLDDDHALKKSMGEINDGVAEFFGH